MNLKVNVGFLFLKESHAHAYGFIDFAFCLYWHFAAVFRSASWRQRNFICPANVTLNQKIYWFIKFVDLPLFYVRGAKYVGHFYTHILYFVKHKLEKKNVSSTSSEIYVCQLIQHRLNDAYAAGMHFRNRTSMQIKYANTYPQTCLNHLNGFSVAKNSTAISKLNVTQRPRCCIARH